MPRIDVEFGTVTIPLTAADRQRFLSRWLSSLGFVNSNNPTIDTIMLASFFASIQFPAATAPPTLQPNICGVVAIPESLPRD